MKKRFLLTSLFMMLFTFVAFASSTYAWFSMNTENKLNEFTLGSANATGGLEISNDGVTFSKTEVQFTSPENFASLDITTADGVRFYKASGVSASGVPTSLEETENAGSDWYEFDLYFRTKVAGSVYIDFANSYIVPESLKPTPKTTGGYTWNHTVGGKQNIDASHAPVAKDAAGTRLSSSSGTNSFTTDWIAAAMRMSYQVTGYQNSMASTYGAGSAGEIKTYDGQTGNEAEQTAYIFEPLSGFKLNVSNLGTYSIGAEAGVDANIKKVDTTGDDPVIGATNRSDNEWITGSGLSASTMYQISTGSPSGKKLSNTKLGYDASSDVDKYQITKVTFRLWVEGQDNAALNALSGGKYAIALSFKLESFGAAKSTITISSPSAEVKTTEGTFQKYIKWNAYSAGVEALKLVKKVASTDAGNVGGYMYYQETLSTASSSFIFDSTKGDQFKVYDPSAEYYIVPTKMEDNANAEYKYGDGTDLVLTTGATAVRGFKVKPMVTVANPLATITTDHSTINWTAINSGISALKIVKRVASDAEGNINGYLYTVVTLEASNLATYALTDSTIAFETGAEYMIVPELNANSATSSYEFAQGTTTWATYVGFVVNPAPAA